MKLRILSAILALLMLTLPLVACKKDTAEEGEITSAEQLLNGEQEPEHSEGASVIDLKEQKSLFYFNDPGHILSCVNERNPNQSQVVTKARLDGAVTEAADAGFDVFVNEIYGMVPWYPSEVLPVKEHIDWFLNDFGGSDNYGFLNYARNGNDFVQVQLEKTHEEGKLYFLSYRMNDLHNLNLADDPAQARIMWISKFWAEHPEYRINQSQNQLGSSFMLDFQYAAVREYKLAMLYELIENYDIDGLLLDFMRAPAYFNLNTTTEAQRKQIITEFVRNVKDALDAKSDKTGKDYYFGVVLPLEDNEFSDLGLDTDALCDAGVEIFIFWDYYFTRASYTLLEETKYLHPGVLVYAMLSQATTRNYDITGSQIYRKTTAEQFYTCAYNAYDHGADGISLFNLPFYRVWQSVAADVGYEPPYELMKNLKDENFLKAANQHYFHGVHYNHLNVPFSLSRVSLVNAAPSFTFTFDMTEPQNGWVEDGILRLEANEDISGVSFTLKVNGVNVSATAYTGEQPYDTPYTDMIGEAKQIQCFTVPGYLLQEGENTFEVTKTSSTAFAVTFAFVDLAIGAA